jgi:DNA-binding response OmpR family regulator
VLIVDDDLKLADVLARSLERAGYDCTVAASGDEALWAFAALGPDALVLDVMIPHPSGSEVCRHLRDHGFAGPIVVMSARGNPDDRAAAERAGADLFLAKPFALAELARALAHLTPAGGT